MVKRFRETARIALSLVLCLGMLGTTVFASEIPDGETTAQEEVQQTEEDAESLEAEESSGTDTSSEDAISGSDNSIDTTENVQDTVAEDAAELSAPEEVVEDVDADSSEITGECTDDDGVTISVDAPEGAFPAGTELVITPEGDMAFDVSFRQYIDDQDASLDEEAEILEDAESGRKYIELQPADGYTVSVKFTLPAIEELEDGETAEVQVVHIADDGAKEDVGEAVTVEADETIEVAVEAESFSTYVVQITVSNSAASLNGEKYESIQKAVDAAGDSTSTIKLLATVTESVTVTSGNITFDLNGYKWTGNNDTALTVTNGTVTIIDDSAVSYYTSGTKKGQAKEAGKLLSPSGYRAIEVTNANLVIGTATNTPIIGSATGAALSSDGDKDYGGVVYVKNGNFTMESGIIRSGRVGTYGCGAGVAVINGTFTMSGGTITSNYGTQGSKGKLGAKGAGVYIDSNDGSNYASTISGGTITGNGGSSSVTVLAGGGVYITGAVTLTVSGGTISSNKAGTGGGIYANAGATLELKDGATISGNTAKGGTGGGGIYVNSTTGLAYLKMYGGTVSDNTADGLTGGGIYVSGNAEISGGTVSDNTAAYGGGLYLGYGSTNTISVTGGSITGNTGTYCGGGIYIYAQSAARAVLSGVTIANNTTSGFGGGVAAKGVSGKVSSLTIDNTVLTYGNTAGVDSMTGLTQYSSDEFAIDTSIFTTLSGFDTVAAAEGEEENNLYTKTVHSVTVNDTKYTLAKAKAKLATGGYAAYFNVTEDVSIKVTQEQCIGNKGEVIVLDPAQKHVHYVWNAETEKAEKLTTENGLYTTLSVAYAAAQKANITTIIVCSTVTVTSADDTILAVSTLTLKRCTTAGTSSDGTTAYTGNTSAVLSISGTVTIDGVTIDGANLAASQALVTIGGGAVLNLKSGTIQNGYNTDGGYGGGISLNGGIYGAKLNMTGGTIQNNTAVLGGGIYGQYCTVTLSGGTISGNTATSYGGGMYIVSTLDKTVTPFGQNEDAVTTLNGTVVFENNTAVIGGGIYFNGGTKHSITGGTFRGNTATGSTYLRFAGGGIYIESNTTVTMENVYVTGNYAGNDYGGAIAACPTGQLELYKVKGLYVDDNYLLEGNGNKGTGVSSDIGVYEGTASKTGKSYVSEYALGGGDNNFSKTNGGTAAEKSYYQNTDDYFEIYANTTGQTKGWAQNEGKVIFEGNVSEFYGSAIATNGQLIIGTNPTSLLVLKEWKDAEGNNLATHPDSVMVQLQYSTDNGVTWTDVDSATRSDSVVILNASNGWGYTWYELGENTLYQAVEASMADYKTTYSDVENSTVAENQKTETITNTYSDGENPGTLTISKTAVNLPEGATYSFTIKLENLSDNTKLLSYTNASGVLQPISVTSEKTATVTIELASGQSITINGLPVGTAYTVTEAADTTSYTTTVNGTSAVSSSGTINANTSAVTLKFENTKVTVVEEEPVPNSPTPTTTITEEDTPLAELPEEDVPEAELPVDIVEVDDEDVPLADVPNTTDEIGQNMSVWIFVSVVALIAAGTTLFIRRKRRDDI